MRAEVGPQYLQSGSGTQGLRWFQQCSRCPWQQKGGSACQHKYPLLLLLPGWHFEWEPMKNIRRCKWIYYVSGTETCFSTEWLQRLFCIQKFSFSSGRIFPMKNEQEFKTGLSVTWSGCWFKIALSQFNWGQLNEAWLLQSLKLFWPLEKPGWASENCLLQHLQLLQNHWTVPAHCSCWEKADENIGLEFRARWWKVGSSSLALPVVQLHCEIAREQVIDLRDLFWLLECHNSYRIFFRIRPKSPPGHWTDISMVRKVLWTREQDHYYKV